MSTIDQVPQENGHPERRSFKILGSLVAALLVCGYSLTNYGNAYFHNANLATEQQSREETMAGSAGAMYFDLIDAEHQILLERSAAIQTMTNSRVLWTKTLDLIIDTINNPSHSGGHGVWLRDFTAIQTNPEPVISATALIESNSSGSRQTALVDDLKANTELFQDMSDITVVKDESRQPPEAVSFWLDLRMKAARDWVRDKKND